MKKIISVLALLISTQAEANQRQPRDEPPPRINLNVAPQEEIYGDWTVATLNNGLRMATTNNSAGSIFGTLCDGSGCTSFVSLDITCQDGESYPALVNSPDSAFSVIVTCRIINDLHLYEMPFDESVQGAMTIGGVLGIAFPMASGEFRVARFSLTGAARASYRARELALGTPPSRRQTASDDETI